MLHQSEDNKTLTISTPCLLCQNPLLCRILTQISLQTSSSSYSALW
nr:MAG TPA: hypothetical protein [Caudoviricetes sp.]